MGHAVTNDKYQISNFKPQISNLKWALALAASTTMAAQAAVSPVLLFHFHEVPGVTLVANLVAFPAVSPALILGLLAGATGLVFAQGGRVIAALALIPLRYLELVADRLAPRLVLAQHPDHGRPEQETDRERGDDRAAGAERQVTKDVQHAELVAERNKDVIEHGRFL